MDFIQGIGSRGAAERDAGSLGGEDGVVEVFLWGGEGGFDGPGAGDVGDVVAVFLLDGCEFGDSGVVRMGRNVLHLRLPTPDLHRRVRRRFGHSGFGLRSYS